MAASVRDLGMQQVEKDEKKIVAKILENSLTALAKTKQRLQDLSAERDQLKSQVEDAENRCDALREALFDSQRRISKQFLVELREKSKELEKLQTSLAKEKAKLKQKSNALQSAKKKFEKESADLRQLLKKSETDAIRARNTLDLLQTDYHFMKEKERGWTTVLLEANRKAEANAKEQGNIQKRLKKAKTSEIHLRNVLMKQRMNFQAQRNLWRAALFKANMRALKLKKKLVAKKKDLKSALEVANELREELKPHWAKKTSGAPNVVPMSETEDECKI